MSETPDLMAALLESVRKARANRFPNDGIPDALIGGQCLALVRPENKAAHEQVEVIRPGRPAIGPAFSVKFPPELLDRFDARARAERVSRAALLRRAAEAYLDERSDREGRSAAHLELAQLEALGDEVDRKHGWRRWAPGGPQYPYIHSIAKRLGEQCWECTENGDGPCAD